MRNIINVHRRLIVVIILLVGTAVIWYVVFSEGERDLAVTLLDIGQGDALFIRTPRGNQILIDGGPGRAVLGKLNTVMPFYDRSIDLLILSHPHADHLGGLVEVLKRYHIGAVLDSGTETDSGLFAEWKRELADRRVRHITARRSMRLALDEQLFFDVLLPSRDVTHAGIHDGMLVGLLRYGNTEIFFSGDMEQNLERYLLALGDVPDIDVLKVGHHGSRTSSSEALLAIARPEYALISAGLGNTYGHPHEETLARFREYDVTVFRTDMQGTAVARSDGEKVTVRPQRCILLFCW